MYRDKAKTEGMRGVGKGKAGNMDRAGGKAKAVDRGKAKAGEA